MEVPDFSKLTISAEDVAINGGARLGRFDRISTPEGMIDLESIGHNFSLSIFESDSQKLTLIQTKENKMIFYLGEPMVAVYNRETGELSAISLSYLDSLEMAGKNGLTIPANVNEAIQESGDMGNSINVMIDVESGPSLSMIKIENGVTSCVGIYAAEINPVGLIGGDEYLYRWCGKTQFAQIWFEVTMYSDFLVASYVDAAGNTFRQRIARYINCHDFEEGRIVSISGARKAISSVYAIE